MAVTVNGTALTSMTYNGQTVTLWIHDGVQVFSATKYLYSGAANEGNFKTYPCIVNAELSEYYGYVGSAGTLTKGSSLTYKQSHNGYSVVSDAVDLTNYKYLHFTHTSVSKSPVAFGADNHIVFFITKTLVSNGKVTATKMQKLISGKNGTASGNVTIDVSSLTGTYYIGFMCHCESASKVSTQITVSNVRLTNT